jgi:hypothetical protein
MSENRDEIVNAARSYEKALALRRSHFVNAVRCHREERLDEKAEWQREFHDAKAGVESIEALLAERIYGEHDFVRVDGVIYMAYSTRTLLRVPVADIPDLAATRNANT